MVVASALAPAACGDPVAAPSADARRAASAEAVRAAREEADLRQGTASAHWGEITGEVLIRRRPSPPAAARAFAYLTLAQYAAVVAAEEGHPRPRAAVQAAVAGASAATLAHFFPAEAPTLEALVREQALASPGHPHPHFAEGEALGRLVAEQVIARARTDRFDAVFTGPVPVGPGFWFSSATPPAPPLLPLLGQMRTFHLTSGSQFRPPPPPPFGSPEFLAALDEVRQIALTRTAEQRRIAVFWAFPAGTILPPGYWNEVARELAAAHRLDERATAHLLALMNTAVMDALIAGHDGKYAYWYIRPTQADPSISLAIGLPNHPSYPSTHGCASGAAAQILASAFPEERARLEGLAEEAGLSRIYGGIHYRFDVDAAKVIARSVARVALEHDARDGLLSLLP